MAGKTILARKLANEDYQIHENRNSTEEFKITDWAISDEEYNVIVQIKERVHIIEPYKKNEIPERAIVLIVIRPDFIDKKGQISSKINYYSEDIPQSCIKILLFNGDRSKNSVNINEEIQELKSIEFREVIWCNIIKDDFLNFKFLLKNIIINSSTNRLDYARKLISNNLKNKEIRLDLGCCSLTNLIEVKELFNNTHLEELIISNEWAEYKDGKWNKKFSHNKKEKNTLGDLPSQISKLKQLKLLIAGGDWNDGKSKWNRWRIQSIKPILKLNKLVFLNLSNNLIEVIPSLAGLKSIKKLHLNNNYISKVTNRAVIISLDELYLSNNKIKTVSFLNKFPCIKTIDLHGNNIRNIIPLKDQIKRLNITNSKWEPDTINIAKNPLEQPPVEIINLGKDAVLNYFEDITNGKFYINKDIKLILVGNSEVGKTTLAKYFDNEVGLDEEHCFTFWMEEKQLKSKHIISKIKEKCNINLFDFGGHDYFHDTHHLFFNKNTVYLLLWDRYTNKLEYRITKQKNERGESEEIETQDYPIKYWLDSIKFFSKEKETENFNFEIDKLSEYNSHVLIIQNKVENINDIVHLNNFNIVEKYPFIYDFINVSIKPKRNLEHLDYLVTEVINATDIIGAKLAPYYGEIKKSISEYEDNPIITFSEFVDYCQSIVGDEITEEKTKYLAGYLVQIGMILYYPSNKHKNDKVYINKKWVIEKIHFVLRGLHRLGGKFDNSYLNDIFGHSLSQTEVNDIIDLMIEFKMIFLHPQSKEYIAPLYLPAEPVKAIELFIDTHKKPFRKFKYTGFIHKNVILNFFQEYGKLTIGNNLSANNKLYYYWKNGLIIKDPDSQEIVMIQFHLGDEEGNAAISVIKLNSDTDTQFVDDIIKYIYLINEGYEIEEMVTNNGVNYIPLYTIFENEKQGNWTFKYNDNYYKLSDFKKFLKTTNAMKKIFISYSKQDLPLVNKFIEHLSALRLDGKVSHWFCSELSAGSNWDLEIKKHFDEADIICFMISPNLMRTSYIHEHEIARAFERKAQDPQLKIVPIILDFCKWNTQKNNLSQFTALPYTLKPVLDFDNQNMAWYIIEECLRLIIDEDLNNVGDDLYSNNNLPPAILKLYERIVEGKVDKNSL